jgi:myo-inositol-1(or 4)-monophosphatase
MASEVDFAVEQTVRTYLTEATPDIGFLGEEEGMKPSSSDLLWVLDPVDGTANYVRGIPLCAVSLGLVRDHRSILGVIDMPFLDSRYSAAEGTGAYLNGSSIHGSECRRLSDAVVAIGDYAVGANAPDKNVTRLALTDLLAANIQRVRMLGTAATDLAWVASGNLDASVMFSNKPWDTTAGVLIAREAGIRVLDIDGSEHDLNSKGCVAVVKPLVDEVMELVHRAQVRG